MRIKQGFLLISIFLIACLLLIFPAEAAGGARNGIGYCLQILIPSLYPFMVLAVFVVKCGLSEKMGKPFERFSRRVLKLPGSSAATILMSAIGGYPTGARSISALYEEGAISEKQAVRMLCFCVNAGPAFVISAVGAGFLRNNQFGVILFVSQLLASMVLSIICGITAPDEPPLPQVKHPRKRRAADALVESAADAARAMISMCCFVVLFAAFISLLRIFVKEPRTATALSAFLEVTGGCADLTRLGVPLWVFSFAIGWGGICVHFQVFSSVGNIRINLSRFVLFRLLHGILAALITTQLIGIFHVNTAVFSNTTAPLTGLISGTVPGAGALIALCVAFIFSLPNKTLEINQD